MSARIIHRLRYHCANGQSIDVDFGRDGQPLVRLHHRWYGTAKERERTIDLRVGDHVFVPPDFQRIERISVLRDEWVEEVRAGEGFVMR